MISRRSLLTGLVSLPVLKFLGSLTPIAKDDHNKFGIWDECLIFESDGSVFTVEMLQDCVRKAHKIDPPIKSFTDSHGNQFYL